MKTIFFLLLCVCMALVSCEQDVITYEPTAKNSRSVTGFTMFQNVDDHVEEATGNRYISGEIYCPAEAEYSFIFAYEGTGGVRYIVQIPGGMLLNENGDSFRTFTRTLAKGINHFNMSLLFSGGSQQGYIRLLITKINGAPLGSEEGYVDLALGGSSLIHGGAGTGEAAHWVCSNCNMINSMSVTTCTVCSHLK